MKITFAASLAVTALSMSMALAQQPQQPATPAPASPPDLGLKVEIEPAAMALVKAMGDKLAAAKSMSFTAFAIFESPDRTGLPLAYTTLSQVTMQRPNKLKVISPGDGPRTEFYYDGKTVNAYEPAAKLVATVDAPDTIDAMLRAAFQRAAIYFPFTDLIVCRSDEDDRREPARRLRRRQVDRGGRRAAPTSSSWSASSPTSSSGSAATTSCRAWRAPSSSGSVALPPHRHVLGLEDRSAAARADTFTFTAPAGAARVPFAPAGRDAEKEVRDRRAR